MHLRSGRHSITHGSQEIGFLMQLPAELRAHIIHHLIQHERPATHNSSERPYTQEHRWEPHVNKGLDRIDYEPNTRDYKPNVLSLLLASRQLYNESKTIVAHGNNICKVDVAIEHGRIMRPTFTCIPPKTRMVDTVYATIHITGDGPACGKHWARRPADHREGPGTAMWLFWELLRGFMHDGPYKPKVLGKAASDMRGLRSDHCPAAIKILDIDVVEPDDPCNQLNWAPKGQSRTDGYQCRHCPSSVECMLGVRGFHAEDTYEFISTSVTLLLNEVRYLYAYQAYTRIGKIRMRLKGDVLREVDLGDALTSNSAFSISERLRWGKKRRRNGLPCPEIEDHSATVMPASM